MTILPFRSPSATPLMQIEASFTLLDALIGQLETKISGQPEAVRLNSVPRRQPDCELIGEQA